MDTNLATPWAPNARALKSVTATGELRNAHEMDASICCNQINAHQQHGIHLESWGAETIYHKSHVYFLGTNQTC